MIIFFLLICKLLRQFRHPNVLKFVDSLEVKEDHFYLMTESVTPLRSALATLEYQEVLLGVQQIAVREKRAV